MAGSLGMKLAEALDFLHRQVIAGEVQQGVNQHRAVPIGQYEPVAVSPLGIGRIVAQMMNPQNLGYFRHAHGHAGVTRIGFLHSIHRQRADSAGQVFEHRRVKISKCSHEHELPRSTDIWHTKTPLPNPGSGAGRQNHYYRLRCDVRQYDKPRM